MQKTTVRILKALLLVLAIAVSFVAGRFSGGWHCRSAPAKDPQPSGESHIKTMPELPFIHYAGASDEDGAVGIHRTPDMRTLTGVGIFNAGKNTVYVEFFKKSGRLHGLSFQTYRRLMRKWTFKEDGSLESETIYGVGNAGVQTFYKEDGTKDREVRVKVQM